MGRIDTWLKKVESRRGRSGSSSRVSKANMAGASSLNRGRQQQQQQQLQQKQRMRLRRPSQLGFVADHSATPARSMLQSLLTLYGMLTLMLGVVIPISDALAKPVEHADYRQIFYIFMHGVGAVSVIYLDALIAFHKSDPKTAAAGFSEQLQQQSLATVEEVRTEDDSAPATPGLQRPPLETQASEIEMATRASPSEAADAAGGGDDPDDAGGGFCGPRRLAQAEVSLLLLPVPSAGDLASLAGAASSRESVAASNAGAGPAAGAERRSTGLAEGLRRQLNVARVSLEDKIESIKKKRDCSRITWSAAGVNIYLRLGSIIFGFGVMVHDGFKIVDVLEKPANAQCAGPWFLPKQIIHLLFIVCQTYYLFKHHRVAINTQNSLVQFILVHLMVTNLCIWGKTVIYEIKLSLLHSGAMSAHVANTSNKHAGAQSHQNFSAGHHNGTGATSTAAASAAAAFSCSQLLEEDSPSHKLGPYLYPCAVEYGLISAAICYKLFTRVGDTEAAVPYGRKESPIGPRATTCHKSHKGLFLGLFIMICVLVPTISLIFLQRGEGGGHKDQHALAVIAVECLVLACTAAMAVLGTAKAVRQLKLYKLHGSEAFDVNLLFVGLAGVVCYNLFVSISVGACLMDGSGSGHCNWGSQSQFSITRLTGIKSLMEVTQSVAQTLFVMQAIQRKLTPELAEGMHKPGRGVTIALLIANLAMWVASVFEAQRDIADEFLLSYFGSMPWSIIKYIFLPLIIFYRFHSTVCLSEIWIQSYKLPKKRLHPARV